MCVCVYVRVLNHRDWHRILWHQPSRSLNDWSSSSARLFPPPMAMSFSHSLRDPRSVEDARVCFAGGGSLLFDGQRNSNRERVMDQQQAQAKAIRAHIQTHTHTLTHARECE